MASNDFHFLHLVANINMKLPHDRPCRAHILAQGGQHPGSMLDCWASPQSRKQDDNRASKETNANIGLYCHNLLINRASTSTTIALWMQQDWVAQDCDSPLSDRLCMGFLQTITPGCQCAGCCADCNRQVSSKWCHRTSKTKTIQAQ